MNPVQTARFTRVSSRAFHFYAVFRGGILRASDVRVENPAHDARITGEF